MNLTITLKILTDNFIKTIKCYALIKRQKLPRILLKAHTFNFYRCSQCKFRKVQKAIFLKVCLYTHNLRYSKATSEPSLDPISLPFPHPIKFGTTYWELEWHWFHTNNSHVNMFISEFKIFEKILNLPPDLLFFIQGKEKRRNKAEYTTIVYSFQCN